MKSAGEARRRESLQEAADLGRKLFATPNPKLTRSNKSCAGCHQAPDLATKAARYPTFHDGLDRVVNLDTAIRFCILKQMDGPSVKPGSKVPVALEMFLKHAR